MNTDPASPSKSSLRQTWYTLRLLRRGTRLVWNKRMAWTLVWLISLTVLYYQWENWRSARELADTRRRLLERIGTEDPMALVPPAVPDSQNYFANATIQSWAKPRRPGGLVLDYHPPVAELAPKDLIVPEIKESYPDNVSALDLAGWAVKRATAGREIPQGQSPASVLDAELGNGNGLLPKLAEGLELPFSMMKPGQRELLQAAGGNVWNAENVYFRHFNDLMRSFGLHLRAAARAGNQAKTNQTALITLRFAEAPSTHALIGGLVSLAGHDIAFDALHEALGCEAWNTTSLTRLQLRLEQSDDIKNIDSAMRKEVLWVYQGGLYFRQHRSSGLCHYIQFAQGPGMDGGPGWKTPKYLWRQFLGAMDSLIVTQCPIGWHDANIAFAVDVSLNYVGPKGDTAWLTAGERCDESRRMTEAATSWPNPRRVIGAVAIPNIGNIYAAAARTLFYRRCLIIACALERHRLVHGAFPGSLEAVQEELALFHVNDPALPDKPLGYRPEKEGYLLWSAGSDAHDDGGAPDQDWLWRMKRAPK